MPDLYHTAWARRPPARLVRSGLHAAGSALITVIVGRTHVSGREHLAALGRPVVLVANHSSHLDTPVVLNALPAAHRRRTVVVAAADYFYADRVRATLVGLAFGTIPVERTSGASAESTERMHRLLDEGWDLLLYPEGTRSRDGRLGGLHTGAARLAAAHGAPLVPVGIVGTHASLPPGSWHPRRGTLHVRFGEPIHVGRLADDPGSPAGRQPSARSSAHVRAVTEQLAHTLRELTGQQ